MRIRPGVWSRRTIALTITFLISDTVQSQWLLQKSGTTERLRAVSAVSQMVAWASGNKGTCVRTTDGGTKWSVVKIPGVDSLDFRDVEAFDENTAYLLSIGSGERSKIYKTTNGGVTWSLQFINKNPIAFFDAMAFWDVNNGIAVSDQVNGRLVIIKTTDGGNQWKEIPPENIPAALPDEGAFAASGTCVVAEGESTVWIGTGVKTARVYKSTDKGITWSVHATPIRSENNSSGIFSIAFKDVNNGIVIGGDYTRVQEARENVAVSSDGGEAWMLIPGPLPGGYRSAVVFVRGTLAPTLVTVGPSGSDYSLDNGKSWTKIDTLGFHAVSFAGPKNAGWAVGEGGRIAKYAGSAPDIRKSFLKFR